MQTSRARVFAALEMSPCDRVPRQQWCLPYVHLYRQAERDRIDAEFPSDFAGPPVKFGVSRYVRGKSGRKGEYTDIFGNLWRAAEDGVVGEVKAPRLADWNDLDGYEMPWEILDEADYSEVDAFCRGTDKFVLTGTNTNPFERMQQIRGTENLFIDLALDTPELYTLRDMFHAFSLREMENWAKTAVDGVQFMDDWGTQISLLISPEKWRRFYKPLYKEYCDILHAAGKKVFFHSDGHIAAIYPDLIEIGVDAVNSQLFCMDIEALGREYAGRITFWGELDRQRIMPFGTEAAVRAAVDRVAAALMPGGIRTGVIAQFEWGRLEPFENLRAAFDQWNKY